MKPFILSIKALLVFFLLMITWLFPEQRVSLPGPQASRLLTVEEDGKAKNITIQGFRIKGRQTVYDGGVRSTILLGNCERCAVMDVYLEDTASIGVTAGGSALEWKNPDGSVYKNNFARDIVFTRNIFSGVAAANTATINTEDAYVFHNYVRRPGHHNPKFGGGVCGHDHETNSPADHDPVSGSFRATGDMNSARYKLQGTGVLLSDGKVLVAGGANRAEVFDPAGSTFSYAAGDMETPRLFATATRLQNGQVLIIGGYHGNTVASSNAWIYRA